MKKFVAMLLVAAVTFSCSLGCGDDKKPADTKKADSTKKTDDKKTP